MMFPAENGYNQVRRQSASPRSIECQILIQISADIENCDRSTVEGYKSLASAVKRNSDLWTAFSIDLASKDNLLTDDLKINLIKLAAFSLAEGPKVLRGDSDPSVLVSINRTVAAGLREAQAVAA